jgi:hypothetical protein
MRWSAEKIREHGNAVMVGKELCEEIIAITNGRGRKDIESEIL